MPFLRCRQSITIIASKTIFLKRCNLFNFRLISTILYNQELDIFRKNEIERKWSSEVNKGCFDPKKNEKFYVLSMFPYPSGNLHMGHVRVYTISDALSRFHRLNGKNVLQPMGFDAFGLPAENAALLHKVNPMEWTYNNIKSMRNQLMSLGFSFDWDREIITCSEDYYKFTQYLFILLYNEGLVYQNEALVNWDPIDQTVLADEQVDSSGRSWRSGALVEKKLLKQWFIKTTHFAQELLEGLHDPNLKDWRDIKNLQEHWIGECIGARFDFDVVVNNEIQDKVSIWVKYPEHINFAVFAVASPSSLIGQKYTNCEVQVTNPFNLKNIPVFVTDELNFDEGCDIRLGIPSYYESDRPFADKHLIPFEKIELSYDFDKRCRICELGLSSGIGGYFVSSKLRDWLISRQRKWGTPIPIIQCKSCGEVPVPLQELPVKLSDPLETVCPRCKGPAKRESDTMDTFVDSSWYFLRYTDPHNSSEPFSKITSNKLMPVDIYIGGKEHAVLHLYYARFITHFLHSINLLEVAEPFQRLLVQGMVMGKTYYIQSTGECIAHDRVIQKGEEFFDKDSGLKVIEVWEKMSKSKFNGVEPAKVLEEYGVDTTRLLVLAEVAPQSHRNWDSSRFSGVLSWQKRLWSLMAEFLDARKSESPVSVQHKEPDLWDARNFYIKGATFSYGTSHQLSVAISKLQGFTNTLKKCNKHVMSKNPLFEKCLGELIIMLYPLAPHFASELWEGLQSAPNRIDDQKIYFKWDHPVMEQKWPKLDSEYELLLVCKVNNAVKDSVRLPVKILNGLDENSARNYALSQKKVRSFVEGCDILNCEFSLSENFEASINLIIDPLQKKRFISIRKNASQKC